MVLCFTLLEVRQLLKNFCVVMYNSDTLECFSKDFRFNWEYLLNADPKLFCKLRLPM